MTAIVLNMKKPLNRFFLLVCLLSVQFGLSGAIRAQQSQLELLGKELENEALTWLEAQGEKFIALWEPDTSGASFGAILILHGEGQTADWPNSINPLRTNLIKFGWSTLSIELPDPVPEETDEDGTAHKNIEEKARERIQAAVNFLDQKGQYNLVIFGQSTGATRGFEFIRTLAAEGNATTNTNASSAVPPTRGPFRALIMVSARNVKLLKDFKLPTLDLYYDEHFLDTMQSQERLALAQKYRLPYYHQLKILKPDETEYGEDNRLTRRVRGFLNKYAKGVEIAR